MEINEEMSAIKKQQHDLIRQLEHKEIQIEEYNEKFHKLQLELEKIDITKPIEPEEQDRESETRSPHEAKIVGATPTPAIKQKKKKPFHLGDEKVNAVIDLLLKNECGSLKEFVLYLAENKHISKGTAQVYAYYILERIAKDEIKGYFYDKISFKLYKKSDLIDENGNPIT